MLLIQRTDCVDALPSLRVTPKTESIPVTPGWHDYSVAAIRNIVSLVTPKSFVVPTTVAAEPDTVSR